MLLLPAPYDIFIERGIAYGPLVITVYDGLPPLATPDAPSVTPNGTSGAATWTYVVVARKSSTSQFSAASTGGTTAVGNGTLDTTNFNRIDWDAVTGANRYDIYRTVSGGTPATLGLIGTTANTTFFNDTGIAGDSATAPSTGGPGEVVDLTGFVAHAHARRIPQDTVLQNLSPIITDEPGGQITIGKFTDEQTLNFQLITNGKWSLVLENSSGDWLPAIMAGAYSVTDSVTRNAPLPIPPPDPPPEPSPYIAYINQENTFTELNTFTNVTVLSGLRLNVQTLGSDFDFSPTGWGYLIDTSPGDVIGQLPPSVGNGQQYYAVKIDASVNVATVQADGSDLIEGSTNVALIDQWSDILLVDGVAGQWILIGGS